MSPWTDEDETVIRCLHGRFPIKTLCAILDRSLDAVKHRVKIMKRNGQLARAHAFGGQA